MKTWPKVSIFQSTLPVWGATGRLSPSWRRRSHFNPRSPCGERRAGASTTTWSSTISIHAPRVGSDEVPPVGPVFCDPISIHAPRVGSDTGRPSRAANIKRFQSTLPVWGATGMRCRPSPSCPYFNPRSPCGERHHFRLGHQPRRQISIHAPRVGSDANEGERTRIDELFQSTLPVWGATPPGASGSSPRRISIHAPRVGSDAAGRAGHRHRRISIHAPRVGSDLHLPTTFQGVQFQSTLPVWGATARPAGRP